MQPLGAIFSSPEKTANGARTPSVNGAEYSENDDDDSAEFPMDIENSTSCLARLLSVVC
jgi:centromere protein C